MGDEVVINAEFLYGPHFDKWYTRAVMNNGYTHDLYSWQFQSARANGFNPEASAYVIKRNGKPLKPEEVISRLQRAKEALTQIYTLADEGKSSEMLAVIAEVAAEYVEGSE